jgi:antirestriction protein ArdC
MEEKVEKRDVYAIITNRIVEQLEQGIVPWRKPWKEAGPPMNLISGKSYRGINVVLLGSLGYDLNCFLTFKQVKELGGSVRKGEKPCPVVFWKVEEKEDEVTKEVSKKPFLKYHNVFNIAQCSKLPKDKLPVIEANQNDPIEVCEEIVTNMVQAPKIKYGKELAYYSVKYDYVSIPEMESFESSEAFYGTLFHELIHSTGHTSRLNRKELMEMNPFGSKVYSIEELTAEIGACYLNSLAGIDNEGMDNNVAYIQSWLEKLQNNKKFIFYASSNAQKAVDFILGIKHEEKTGITVEREEVMA